MIVKQISVRLGFTVIIVRAKQRNIKLVFLGCLQGRISSIPLTLYNVARPENVGSWYELVIDLITNVPENGAWSTLYIKQIALANYI